MKTNKDKPVVLIVTADNQRDLPRLIREREGIRKAFKALKDQGLIEVELVTDITASRLQECLLEYKDRLSIFHFAGHATKDFLKIANDTEIFPEGLLPLLSQRKSLKLAFLNGCSTLKQIETLSRNKTRNNILAAIGTVEAVPDDLASELAINFYQQLVAGDDVQTAWGAAEDRLKLTRTEGEISQQISRDLESSKKAGLSWEIRYSEPEVLAKSFSLATLLDDPLYNLPLSEDDLKPPFPKSPFKSLQPFSREDAAIFFGRGKDIRELYRLICSNFSIILLHGQSGVGKSSLLHAGFIPRMENKGYRVKYQRRSQDGLVVTFRELLQEAYIEAGIPKPMPKNLHQCWQKIEVKDGGEGLIIILDQAEELFTQQKKEQQDNELLKSKEILTELFAPQKKPRLKGTLILSFRKEFYADFHNTLEKGVRLPITDMLLKPLDQQGIIEAVTGVAGHYIPEIRNQYKINVEKSEDQNLPLAIAADLINDVKSTIAPILQMVLYQMWEKQKNKRNKNLYLKEYRDKWRNRNMIRHYLLEKMQSVEKDFPYEIRQGLVLDILHFHITDKKTAGRRSTEEIKKNYDHIKINPMKLVQCLVDNYLLIKEEKSKFTRLVHDALVRVILDEFQKSFKMAQRASRVLQHKTIDFEHSPEETWLDSRDKIVIEKAEHFMRKHSDIEKKILNIIEQKFSQDKKPPQDNSLQNNRRDIHPLLYSQSMALDLIEALAHRGKAISPHLKRLKSNHFMISMVFSNFNFNLTGKIKYQLNKVNISELVSKIINALNYKAEFEYGIEIKFINDQSTMMFLDELLFELILFNIILNAIQYSVKRSKIIEINHIQQKITFEGIKNTSWEVISIKNWGIGILEEEKELIFTELFRGSNAYLTQIDGSGLGLAVSKEIIEDHDGFIRVTSLHSPTIFSIYLPSYLKNQMPERL